MKPIQLRNNNLYGSFIEINLLGDKKICSYNCGYCNLGETNIKLKEVKDQSQFPAYEDILFELKAVLSANKNVQSVVVSGNGEPTLLPQFYNFSKELSEFLEMQESKPTSVLVTNGAHFDSKKILEATSHFNNVVIKLDVGTEDQFKVVNSPLIRGGLERVVTNARKIKNVSIQTMIVELNGVIPIKEKFDDYCELVGMISPKTIYLQSLSETPVDKSFKKVLDDEIEIIASLLRRKFETEVRVS